MMATITRDGELTAPWGFTVTLRGEEAGTVREFPVYGLIYERPLYRRETLCVEAIRLERGNVVAVKHMGEWCEMPVGTPFEVVACESNPEPVVNDDDEEADHA